MYCLKRYKKKKGKRVILWLLALFLMIFIGILILQNDINSGDLNKNGVKDALTKSIESVVCISSANGDSNIWGSGTIISKRGYILTNEHIVGDGLNCYVLLSKNEKKKAEVVWSNSDLDLSIIKIDKEFENCQHIIDSENIQLGEEIYAIGNPIGRDFEKTITKGIISGLNRNIEFEEEGKKFYLTNLIQIDASINNGNSGGALINEEGYLIGICTIKITSADGIAFAVPANIVKPIVEKLENEQTYKQPHMGVRVYDKYTIEKLNLGLTLNSGVYIGEVNPNSNIEKSGLRVGDVITRVDDTEINTVNELRKILYDKNVGDEVKYEFYRDKTKYEIVAKTE